MLSKIYNILPSFLKRIVVEIHRDLRLLWFFISPTSSIKACKASDKELFTEYQKSRIYGPLKHICYAPKTSMFFARNGKVSPCYASYNDKSSNILTNSISKIWFKGSINEIREEHEKCNLESSCKFCKNLIDNKSFGSLLANKYEHYAFSKSKYPAIMEFELSNKCNLACIMCDSNLSSSIASNNSEQNKNEELYGDKFIEELKEFIPHLQLAEFTGGDPFMIDIYYKIWDLILELNPKCQILITTNANSMNPKIEKLLSEHKNIHFNVSIDSLDKTNYEEIRINGRFEFAMKNLDTFIDYTRTNNTSLNILVCPMTVNSHELGDFVNFANDKNICVYYHTVVKPKQLSLKFIDKTELQQTINGLEAQNFPSTNTKEKTNAENYKNLIVLLKNWATEDKKIADTAIELNIDEAKSKLKDEISKNAPDLLAKFDLLLNELNNEDKLEFILNKLLEVDNTTLIEYLNDKSIEELKYICISFKTSQSD